MIIKYCYHEMGIKGEWVMKNNHMIAGSGKNNALFMENWIPEAMSVANGLYHLGYEEGWVCRFIGHVCLEILGCSSVDFLDCLRKLPILSIPEQTVGELLEEIRISGRQTSFVSRVVGKDGSYRYLRGTWSVCREAGGKTEIYGHLADLSEMQEKDIRYRDMEEEYKAGLDMSGRSMYRYQIEGRRAYIPEDIARIGKIPEVINDLPEYNIQCGRIAPQSVEAWRGIFDAIDKGEKEGAADIIFRIRDGRLLRRCRVEFTGIRDENGNPSGAILSHRDVTEEYEEGMRQALDRASLQKITQMFFSQIMMLNLTRGSYRILQCYDSMIAGISLEGNLNDLTDLMLPRVDENYRQEFKNILNHETLCERIRQGEEKIKLSYRCISQNDSWHWMESIVMHQPNPYNEDVMAVLLSHNIDQQKEAEIMAANERIFNIVSQHSDRILCYYDMETGQTVPWNKEDCESCRMSHMCLKDFTLDQLNNSEYILPDSKEAAARMYENIHKGIPFGETHIHLRMPDDTQTWMEFKYSGVIDGGVPKAAIISFKDITLQHEQELTYKCYTQSLKYNTDGHLIYVESDLTADRIEKLAGQLLRPEDCMIRCTHSEFRRLMERFRFEFMDPDKADEYFSCSNLMALYAKGIRNQRSEWKVRFPDDSQHWLEADTALMSDTYNGHINAFFRMVDITEEREERLSAIQRADFDAMTGLMRKGAGEKRIREIMEGNRSQGGILIALDLDDLKSINDNYGHKQGDVAIMGIANMLKSFFRKDDVLIRFGGDEFLVFMPGAGESVSSVELIMSSLLRKLSGIAIGQNKEKRIHCSAGCAVEELGKDTFDSLYRRADVALYHVKRNGKNNFVFFEPHMIQDDQDFQRRQNMDRMGKEGEKEYLPYILETMASYFEESVGFNLTDNYYHVLSTRTGRMIEPGPIELFWKKHMDRIHPDDREHIIGMLSRDSLLASYEKGEYRIQYSLRYAYKEKYRKADILVHLFTKDRGDICAFLFLKWDTTPEKDQEILRLQKIVDLSMEKNFEYILLIDLNNTRYATISRDPENMHRIPEEAEYDKVIHYIRDTQIPEGEKEVFDHAMSLKHILIRLSSMNRTQERYQYKYTCIDGITREVIFSWYEDSHFELLVTICRC